MTSSSRSLNLVSGPVAVIPPGGVGGRRLRWRARLGLVLGLSLTLLGVGYFAYHWAYGHWSYQRRHVRLRQEYLLFLEKHESELQFHLSHAGPDHRCERCNPASDEAASFFQTRDRTIAEEQRRIAVLRSEADWQDWLAGPWQRRTDRSVAGWNAIFPVASENSPRTSPDPPLPSMGSGPMPSSFGAMRAAPGVRFPPTGRSGGPLSPPIDASKDLPQTSSDSQSSMQGGGPITSNFGEMRFIPMVPASPTGRSGGPLPPPIDPARKNP